MYVLLPIVNLRFIFLALFLLLRSSVLIFLLFFTSPLQVA